MISAVSLLTLCLLECFTVGLGQILDLQLSPAHSAGFLRSKRANRFLLEELLQGNLERECWEERCNYEEAREVFENDHETFNFWTVYLDGDQCESSPCLHGGNCSDRIGGFICSCVPPHFGPACEYGIPPATEVFTIEEKQLTATLEDKLTVKLTSAAEVAPCPTDGPASCHHMCEASGRSFSCSCAPGFSLQGDGRSCRPSVPYPCGSPPDSAPLRSGPAPSLCRHGNCRWEVSLVTSEGAELCSGAVLGRRSILTTARCLTDLSGAELGPEDLKVVAAGESFSVRSVAFWAPAGLHGDGAGPALLLLHSSLDFSITHLCLPTRDFSENVLMHAGSSGLLGGGASALYAPLEKCRQHLNASRPLTNRMFCMRQQQVGGASHLRTGTPVVTERGGTAFLTGTLLLWADGGDPEAAAAEEPAAVLVFVRVSRFLPWITEHLQAAEQQQRRELLEPDDL